VKSVTSLLLLALAAGCAGAPPSVPDRSYLQEIADRWEGVVSPPGSPPEYQLPPVEVSDSPGGRVPVLPVRGGLVSAGDLWCATDRGLLREIRSITAIRPGALNGDENLPAWRYYAGKRWLPQDRVTGLALDGSPGIWARTEGGYAHIYFRSMTLEEKTFPFEERIQERHVRHGLVASARLVRPGDLTSAVVQSGGNDGLWTALYTAAEAFRHAVTGSDEALGFARRSHRALDLLQRVSGLPGLPARSVVRPLEPDGSIGEWHSSPDGAWLWRGDTSSDELVGQYFAAGVYFDLVADEEEKEFIRGNIRAMTDRIIESGYYLIDADGEPTTWGVWAPEKLNDDPGWRLERGLNSLEILSFLATAEHITGDSRYRDASNRLIERHGYAENTIRQKIIAPEEKNHSDDQLAFLSYYNLLRYEADGDLRAVYLRSLKQSFSAVAPEANPLWTFIAAASGLEEAGARKERGPGALKAAVQTLRDTPMDMIHWRMENSHRRDLVKSPHLNRFRQPCAMKPLHPAERGGLKYNSDPYVLDGGGRGASEDDGAYFLLSYWMGRYHGFISPVNVPVPGDGT